MKYKTTNILKLRPNPSTEGDPIKTLPFGTVLEGEEYSWKKVTLSDGTTGYCAANFLEEVKSPGSWHSPLPDEYFKLSQGYLNEDWKLYPKFGRHTGVDYGGHGKTGIPLYACADGEIIYSDVVGSVLGVFLGNHVALYVSSVDKTFLYCHMPEKSLASGKVSSGDQIGVMGNTGKSAGGAIHLHLEGYHGRFQVMSRNFISLDDIKQKTFDADQFIRQRIQKT